MKFALPLLLLVTCMSWCRWLCNRSDTNTWLQVKEVGDSKNNELNEVSKCMFQFKWITPTGTHNWAIITACICLHWTVTVNGFSNDYSHCFSVYMNVFYFFHDCVYWKCTLTNSVPVQNRRKQQQRQEKTQAWQWQGCHTFSFWKLFFSFFSFFVNLGQLLGHRGDRTQ